MRSLARFVRTALAVLAMLSGAAHAGELHRRLVWSDEFSGGALDARCWTPETTRPGNNWDERQRFTASPDNVHVAAGSLWIEARQRTTGSGADIRHYTSAQVTTQDKAYWTYGYYEARIKAPIGHGAFPAFWMMPQFSEFGGWPDSGEIDIFEYIARDANILYSALHFRGDDWRGGRLVMAHPLASDFHVYGFEWLPHRMRWFVDGQLYWEKTTWLTPDPKRPRAPFDAPFYLILNLSVGGKWPHDPLPFPLTKFPMRYQIDYVRVYAIDGVADPRPRTRPAAGDKTACPLRGPGGLDVIAAANPRPPWGLPTRPDASS